MLFKTFIIILIFKKHRFGQKINVEVRTFIWIKLASLETFVSIGLSKICYDISQIFGLQNVTCIFITELVNVGKKLEGKSHYF